MQTLLESVRMSVRVRTDSYDDELIMYALAALYDLDRLNIKYNHFDDKENIFNANDVEPEVVNCVCTYVKSQFGNTQADYKEKLYKAYVKLRDMLMLDVSHKHSKYTNYEV